MMSTIVLLRHGITEGNRKRLYYGSTDLHLIPEGIEEIRKRKEAGIYPASEGYIMVTSALVRTSETLSEIYGETDRIADKRLNEVDFGEFEMKSYEDLKDDPRFIEWCDGDNWSNLCPGGESGQIMVDRASMAMEDYIGKNCIIVCHGGIISSMMLKWFPDDEKHMIFYDWTPRPCEGYKICFNEENKAVGYEEIKLAQQ